MDSLNHATAGFLMGYIPTQNIYIGGVCAVIGMLPDIVADLHSLGKDKWTEFSKWWYESAHSYKLWYLNILPPALLHIFLDSFCHGKNKTWYFTNISNWNYFNPFKWFIKGHRIWMETITWLILLALTWLYVTPYLTIGILILLTTIIFISELNTVKKWKKKKTDMLY